MKPFTTNKLVFNVGFLLEGTVGDSREITLDFPGVFLDQELLLQPLSGQFRVSRTMQGLYVKGALHSQIEQECTRCLEPFTLPMEIILDDHYYVRAQLPSNDALFVPDSGMLDITELVREMAVLSVPMHRICRPDCQGLCIECGTNLNEEECGCHDEEIDPRLAQLSQLLKGDQDGQQASKKR